MDKAATKHKEVVVTPQDLIELGAQVARARTLKPASETPTREEWEVVWGAVGMAEKAFEKHLEMYVDQRTRVQQLLHEEELREVADLDRSLGKVEQLIIDKMLQPHEHALKEEDNKEEGKVPACEECASRVKKKNGNT